MKLEAIVEILSADISWQAFWSACETEGVEAAQKRFCSERAAQIAQVIGADEHVMYVLSKNLQSAVCEVIMAASAIEKECGR